MAIAQTGLALETLPQQYPWSVDEIRDPDCVPEACGSWSSENARRVKTLALKAEDDGKDQRYT